MTRFASEPSPPYIRSGVCTCSMIPLAADSDPRDETILQRRLFEAMSFVGSSTEDLPGPIGPGRLLKSSSVYADGVVRAAPSMTTPVFTYFHSATSSLRASATIAVFLYRPPFCMTRVLNHWLSAEFG